MKLLIALIILNMLCTFPVFSGDKITCEIISKQPIIIDGNWIYPDNGQYNVAMTDSNITVNGYVYLYPEDQSLYKYVHPSKKENFLDWVIRVPSDSAQSIINGGGTAEDARLIMESFFDQFADGDTFIYEKKEGLFKLTYKGRTTYVEIPASSLEEKTPYRERAVIRLFEELCLYLKEQYLIVRGTNYKDPNVSRDELIIKGPRSSYVYKFPNSIADDIIDEIATISDKAEIYFINNYKMYKSVAIMEKYKLNPAAVEDLMSPKPLKRVLLNEE